MRFIQGHYARTWHVRPFAKSPEERFWDNVDTSGGPDACWPWTGYIESNGYGRFSIDHRNVSVHRYSYELHKGKLGPGMDACHTCDYPRCCNPAHLFEGTDGDNMADRDRKGRQARGERSGLSKLTADQVRAIRQRYAEGGITHDQLAEMFNTSPANVCFILTRRTWRHLE